MKKPTPKFKIGTPVVLWSDSRNPRCRKEYGLIAQRSWHSFLKCWEYRVVFFGFRWPPKERDLREPYVLRYLETSLRTFDAEQKRL